MTVNNVDLPPSVAKKVTIGFFRNMIVNPVKANTSNIMITLLLVTPQRSSNFFNQLILVYPISNK